MRSKNKPFKPRTLVDAVVKGDAKEFESLLAQNAPLDEKSGQAEKTALIWAVLFPGREEMALTLIEKGAALDEQDIDGNTALTLAIRQNQPKIVKSLLSKGARIDIPDSENDTAETLANHSSSEISQMLKNECKRLQRQAEEKIERRKKALLGAVTLQHDLRRPRLKIRPPQQRNSI